MHVPVLEMVVEAEPELLGNLRVLPPFTTWVDIPRTCPCPLPQEKRVTPMGHTLSPWVWVSAPSPRQIPGCGMWRTKHRGLQPALPSPGSASSTEGNRCVEAAEACTADEQCQQLRSEYVAQCLGRAGWRGPGSCVRSRCRRALRRFFARGPPALTHALLFCGCEGPACAERRRQTFAPACAFSGPQLAPPSCLKPLDRCERSRRCRPRLFAFQASCAPAPGSRDGCPEEGGPRCLRAYAGLVGTVVTPNYLDNVSARVAPWCGCEASGNRREECEAFRKLFTRNPCLDGAIQAFDSSQPSVLQDQWNPYQNAGCCFLRVSSMSILTALALQALL
ncbi:GDNF family receptor alpha-4 isoform X2 [Rattus norvegicus]|uniref:GDNF family receptor alpha-4 isoform X2 n=1 Tax=Rattus norvegicus TaxID=10116 RepID=UPI0003D082FD|nr:GDNF family receptor alpha-4 isoform X2 [Rattus norvegicus]|eukprot:XP_006235104.1 PREDICTED: GDNF family receptor alpha-4 isoform X3 [Rattus norvegicus]